MEVPGSTAHSSMVSGCLLISFSTWFNERSLCITNLKTVQMPLVGDINFITDLFVGIIEKAFLTSITLPTDSTLHIRLVHHKPNFQADLDLNSTP
jgi:hypothetical protein